MDTTTDAAEAGRLTRAQVAKKLGISVAGVRRREGKTLHPEVGPKGERLFDAAEVEAERQRMLAEGQPEPMPASVPAQPGTNGVLVEGAPVVPEKAAPTVTAGTPSDIQGQTAPVATTVPTPPPAEPEADGVLAAEVFGLFSDGKSPVQAVISTKLAPAVVAKLYEDWQRLQAMDVTSAAAQSRISAVAADVVILKAQVENLADLADGFRRAIDVHDQNVPAFVDDLSSITERVDAIEQQLADPPLRKRLDFTNDMVGNLIVRLTDFERTFQSWVPYMQAICQRMRV